MGKSGKNKETGFDYYLEEDILKDYGKWTADEKLKWLTAANRIRKYYPKEIVKEQEKLRRGEV